MSFLTAAAKDDDSDKDDNPAARVIVAEERIKAAHSKPSLHYLKNMSKGHCLLMEKQQEKFGVVTKYHISFVIKAKRNLHKYGCCKKH